MRSRRDVWARSAPSAAALLAAGAVAVSTGVAWHTAVFLWSGRPVLPISDGWAPWDSLRGVVEGSTTPFDALTALHNEHRVIVARLLFVADLFAGGRDRIASAASLAFQGVQIVVWLRLLARAEGARWLRWIVGATAIAMLLTLRQGDNFVSGFQAQFTGVFACDVATAMVLFGDQSPSRPASIGVRRLCAAGAFMLLAPLTMANGFLTAPACAAIALLNRLPSRARAVGLAVVATTLSIALDRSLAQYGRGGTPLAFTGSAALHGIAYLGGTVTSGRVPWALAAGSIGIASTTIALAMAVRGTALTAGERVALQVQLFCLASAAATGAGRVGAGFGVDQALSGRYATASATFWSACLVFWASRHAERFGRAAWSGRLATTATSILLLFFVVRDEHSYDRTLARQGAAAERIADAFEDGRRPDRSDLAEIGVGEIAAGADLPLIERLRRRPTPIAIR